MGASHLSAVANSTPFTPGVILHLVPSDPADAEVGRRRGRRRERAVLNLPAFVGISMDEGLERLRERGEGSTIYMPAVSR